MNSNKQNLSKKLTPKFDTCFFERYAKITLETILGERYSALVNRDRPDLQCDDSSLGIEVTRAMRESKLEAIRLLNEMAADVVIKEPDMNRSDLCKQDYLHGLTNGDYVGHAEYIYWLGASPMTRVIENKVGKVINGFYGDFDEYGLYIFTKDDMSVGDLIGSMNLVMNLQSGADRKFKTLYISEIDNLYVCDVATMSYEQYHISDEMCRMFFKKAYVNE